MSVQTTVQKPISPLRQRMLDEMALRAFTDKTQNDYIRHIKTFTAFIGRMPDTATSDHLRAFQAHLRQSGVQPPSMNSCVSALRFFFKYACDQPDLGQYLRIVKQPQKLPIVLTQEEASRLMEAAPGPKYKAVFGTAYGAGLRVSEVANLKVSDIDSTRMLLRVEQGKGAKDRNAMLSPRLLQFLRYRPAPVLHPVGDAIGPRPTVMLQRSGFSRRASSRRTQTRIIRRHVLFCIRHPQDRNPIFAATQTHRRKLR